MLCRPDKIHIIYSGQHGDYHTLEVCTRRSQNWYFKPAGTGMGPTGQKSLGRAWKCPSLDLA